MNNPTETKTLSRQMRNLMEAQDWDRLLPMISPSIRAHVGGQELHKDAWLTMGRGFMAAFPDLRHEPLEQIVSGDQVVIRYVVRGTHKGDFMGVPASGRAVALHLIVIDRWEDGRLTEHSAQFDSMGLLQQLGAIPSA